jgi:hypothetical protein
MSGVMTLSRCRSIMRALPHWLESTAHHPATTLRAEASGSALNTLEGETNLR